MDELLTPMQAAKILGVHYMTVMKRIWSGKIPARRTERKIVITKADLERYINSLPSAAKAE